ncbi:mucin-2 isoform X2 [Bradysia coprophila]|uniref:mucin-2 isoform X2 n=1 Tax=Bradysia coprophila TaxID=38358 RepID=UPI00187D75B7|nr:mucin-2 isoform X2 [Bradysia coprophila]
MRSAILLLCIFTATTADISLISLGTQNAADDGYVYNRPSVPFELPPREVIIKPPGPPAPVVAVTPRTKYNYPTPSTPFKPNEIPTASKEVRIIENRPVIITPRPVPPVIRVTPREPETSKGYDYPPPQPQLRYPNQQEENRNVPQQVKIPVSTRPTTTTSPPKPKVESTYLPPVVSQRSTTLIPTTPKPVQSSYLPPSVPVTKTIRPTTARSIINTPKEGYSYDKPIIPFETATNKLRVDPPTPKPITTPRPVQSSYLPPAVPVTTTARPATARSIINTPKEGYSYDKPIIPFETATNRLRVDPPTPKPITTPKPVQSSYLPPAVPVTTTARPTTARSIINTPKEGYSYDKPIIPFETATNRLRVDPPTPKPITTPKPVQSSYLPPAVTVTTTARPTTARSIINTPKEGYSYDKPIIPFETVTNRLRVDPPTPKPITTPKPVQSSYLPPAVPVTTTARPTTARSIINTPKEGYSYDKPIIPFETATNKLRVDPPTFKPITTPRPVQSSYLPPAVTVTTTIRPTPARSIINTPKEGYSYDKPIIPFETATNKLKVDPPTPKPITTPKPVESSYLPPAVPVTTTARPTTARLIIETPKEGYSYDKPIIPFETVTNKLKVDPPTPKPITTPKPVQSSYLPPAVPVTTTVRPTPARSIINTPKEGYSYDKPIIPFETATNKVKVDPPTPKSITTPKPVQSSYLPPAVPVTTTARPTTARLIIETPKEGYSYDKPIIPFETVTNKLKVYPPTPKPITTPKPVQSSYLPPVVPVTTIARPTTARPIINTPKERYSYDKPIVPFESASNKLKVDPPITRPITTQKPVYLPPEVKTTTPASRGGYKYEKPEPPFNSVNDILRNDQPKDKSSASSSFRKVVSSKPNPTYLPPQITVKQAVITTTHRPSSALPKQIPVSTRGSYRYDKPALSADSSGKSETTNLLAKLPSTYLPPSSNVITNRPTTTRSTTTRPTTTRPTTGTPRFVASTYLPPNEIPSQSETNLKTQKPSTLSTTIRTTPKSVPSTYLPPASDKPTTKKQQTTRATTTRPTTRPTPKLVASTYLPPPNTQKPTTQSTTVQTTPKSLPSTYLPPSSNQPTTRQPITRATTKPSPKYVASTYLPPSSNEPTTKQQQTTRLTTTRPTTKPTLKSVVSTYLPPLNEKVPQQSQNNVNIQTQTTRLTTVRTTPKSVASTYLPPASDRPTTKQQTTRITTTRPTFKVIASTYLPPPNGKTPEESKTNLNTQRPVTQSTTVRSTPKSVPSTYLPPVRDTPTTRQQQTTTTRPTTRPTLKLVASTYLPPPNGKTPEESKTNLNTQKPVTQSTTVRSIPKSVPSTYLPPARDTPTTRQQQTTTTRPTTRPTFKVIASTYLPPPNGKTPEESKTNLNTQRPVTQSTTVRSTPPSVPSTYLPPTRDTPTTRQQPTTRVTTTRPTTRPTPATQSTTVRSTPRSVPSTYLPPASDKPTTKQQQTTRLTTTRPTTKPTLKSVVSTYLPPQNEKPDQSKTNLKVVKTTSPPVRTTSKPVGVTYLPPKEGYDYPKPAIPFNF